MAEILTTPSLGGFHSGVRVITCKLQRNKTKTKVATSIPVVDKIRGLLPTGVEETLMVNESDRIAVRRARLYGV